MNRLQETKFRYDEVFKDLISAHPGKLFAAVNLGGTRDDIMDWENRFDKLGLPTFPDLARLFQALGLVLEYTYLKNRNAT